MTYDRRAFLKTFSAGAIGAGALSQTSAAQEKLQTGAGPILNLALAAYSFKPHYAFQKRKSQEPRNGKAIDMFGFIDYCAEQGCGAELTSYFFPPDADEAYFLKIKRHAFLNGVPIVGTAIGNNFTMAKGEKLDQQIADAKLWIERAAVMGAPHIRLFAGKRKEWEAAPENKTNAIASLQECADHAAKFGIFVGVENHGDLSGDQVIEIVKGVESDWFGVNLDSGNFVSEDPYAEFAQCAPFAVNVQIKTEMKTPKKGVLAHADLKRVAQILKDANYRGNVVLEYEEEDSFEGVPGAMDQLRKFFGS
ncbi:sugar phosphate isomerase/epimerase [Akkermansiaceae bacterium]|nr:sugar phosphate isomerase/epimerase [Akkermansiaceae bacterium]MDB4328389.1 sugar phosphate isomerase/epimerase [Akkermansiaceae bacterium]